MAPISMALHSSAGFTLDTYITSRQGRPTYMKKALLALAFIALCLSLVFGPSKPKPKAPVAKTKSTAPAAPISKRDEALRLNNLGAPYMNQQEFAKAQKYFEQALQADPKFEEAR